MHIQDIKYICYKVTSQTGKVWIQTFPLVLWIKMHFSCKCLCKDWVIVEVKTTGRKRRRRNGWNIKKNQRGGTSGLVFWYAVSGSRSGLIDSSSPRWSWCWSYSACVQTVVCSPEKKHIYIYKANLKEKKKSQDKQHFQKGLRGGWSSPWRLSFTSQWHCVCALVGVTVCVCVCVLYLYRPPSGWQSLLS